MGHGAPHDRPEELLEDVAWLRRLAGALVGDPHEADDLAQKAWLAALERPGEAVAPRSWLTAVMRNLARRGRRTARRSRTREELAARPEGTEAADELFARAALHRQLVDCVMALDEPFRTAVLMRYLDHLPPREIARRLDVPVRTVGSRLARGMERLRAELDRGPGGRAAWLPGAVGLASAEAGHRGGIIGALIMGWKAKAGAALIAIVVGALGVRELARRADKSLLPPQAQSEAAAPGAVGTEDGDALLAASGDDSREPVAPASELAIASPTPLQIRGHVTDGGCPEAGIDPRPTPEARVNVWLSQEEIESPAFRKIDAEASVQGGEFEVTLADPGYRPVHLYVQVPGEGVQRWAETTAAIAQGERAASVDLLRAHEGLLRGTVQDDAGAPLEGALVTGFPRESARAKVESVTDAEGRFQLVALGPINRLGAQAPGCTLLNTPVPRTRAEGGYEEVLIVVTRAGQLIVRARDASGAAISGATVGVQLAPEELPSETEMTAQEPRTVQTDASGVAQVAGVWIGKKLKVVLRYGRAPTTRTSNALTFLPEPDKVYDKLQGSTLRLVEDAEGSALLLPPAGVLEVDLCAPPELVLRGTARLPDGTPVSEPAFEIVDEGLPDWDEAHLLASGLGDAQGKFEVRFLRDRVPLNLGVLAEDGTLGNGFNIARRPIQHAGRLSLDPAAAVADDGGNVLLAADVVLAPAHAISGTLLDEDGKPVLGAGHRVYAVPSGSTQALALPELGGSQRDVVKEGAFRIEGLPDAIYDVYAACRGDSEPRLFSGNPVRVANIPAGTSGLKITVPSPRGVHVRLHIHGAPAPDFLAVLAGSFYPADGRAPTPAPATIQAGELGHWPVTAPWDWNGPMVEHGPQGSGCYEVFSAERADEYELPEVGEGWYRFGVRVRVRAPGRIAPISHFPIATAPLYLRPGEYDVHFNLTPVAPLRGRLVAESSVADLGVQLLDPGGRPLPQREPSGMFGKIVTQYSVASDGAFRFLSAPVGKRTLRIGTPAQLKRGEFLREVEVEVVADGDPKGPLEIRL